MAARSDALRTGQGARVQVTGPSEDQKRGEAIENALMHRFAPTSVELTDHGRQFRGMTLLEMGSECLDSRGVRTAACPSMSAPSTCSPCAPMSPTSPSARAARSRPPTSRTSSPTSPQDPADGVSAAPQTFRPLVRVVTIPDFKPVSRVQMGEAPKLERVLEGGEIKRGAMGDSAEKYALSTYAKIVSITRAVIINDDLDAFTRVPRSFGVAAANLESDLVMGRDPRQRPDGRRQRAVLRRPRQRRLRRHHLDGGRRAGRQAMRNQTGSTARRFSTSPRPTSSCRPP